MSFTGLSLNDHKKNLIIVTKKVIYCFIYIFFIFHLWQVLDFMISRLNFGKKKRIQRIVTPLPESTAILL